MFDDLCTTFSREDPSESPDLAKQLTVKQRMRVALKKGAMTPEAVAEEIEANLETVKRIAWRYRNLFTVIDGGRLGLLERTAS